jgi:hypothetical protein
VIHIVGVHGINQHRSEPDALADRWREALDEGLRAATPGIPVPPFTFRLVYYADILRAHRRDWKGVDDAGEVDPVAEPGPAELLVLWAEALGEPVAGSSGAAKGLSMPATRAGPGRGARLVRRRCPAWALRPAGGRH